jgi:hypothetical protein
VLNAPLEAFAGQRGTLITATSDGQRNTWCESGMWVGGG